MRIVVQFKTAATYLVIINLTLISIGTFFRDRRTVGVSRALSKYSNDRRPPEADVTVAAKKNDSSLRLQKVTEKPPPPTELAFSRIKWTDVFTFGDEKLVLPTNFTASDNLMGNDFVLGITTIARDGVSYLHDTLRSLITNLQGYTSLVILVYVGEEDPEIANKIASGIKESFPTETTGGLIHIIFPPKNYYPDWKRQLRQSFNDDFKRVKWRSKQNLDQIYLMAYSYHLRPKYYLMLEDDIVAAKGYLSTIYADAASKKDRNYVLISYCQLGAIGKLLRREMLPSLVKYFQLFWSDKPLDWLIYDYMRGRVCDISKSEKDCSAIVSQIEIVYKPSLFQHVGTSSSFPGKIQKLKDKAFKKT